MKKTVLLATASAFAINMALGLGSAKAADPIPVATSPIYAAAPISSWAGFYAGLHIGYGTGDLGLAIDNASLTDVATFQTDPNGGITGIHAGYNWQWSNGVVAGVEVDADWLIGWDTRGWSQGHASDNFSGSANWLGSIRGRLGFDIDGQALAYITGGVAYIDAEQRFHVGNTTPETVSHDWGGVIGIGLEHKITQNLSVRGEALYYFFGDESWNSSGGEHLGEVDYDVFSLRIGGSYHF